MILLLFILLNYGISNIIVYGSIFEGFRSFWERVSPNFFGVLFNCMVCTPFWTGLILSLTFKSVSPFNSAGVDFIPFSIFLDGCLSSGTVWLLHTFQEMMERTSQKD